VDFISEGYCLRLYGLKTVAALFYVFFFLFSFYFSFFRSFSSLSISGRLVFVTSVFFILFFYLFSFFYSFRLYPFMYHESNVRGGRVTRAL